MLSENAFDFIYHFLKKNYRYLVDIAGILSAKNDEFIVFNTDGDNKLLFVEGDDDCYKIHLYGHEDVDCYFDFNKKLVLLSNKEKLSKNELSFFTALEMELQGDNYVSHFDKEYSGVLPETCYRFDTGFFEIGALVQIHVLKNEPIINAPDIFYNYGWKVGYRYNAIVTDHKENNTKLLLLAKCDKKIHEVTISAEEVEKGIVKLIRIG